MEGEDEASGDPRAFSNQRAWKRIIILLAGSAVNFLFGLLLILFIAPQLFPNGFRTAEVTAAMDGSQFIKGDVIYKIDGERINSSEDALFFLDWHGTSHTVAVIRGGKTVELKVEKTLTDPNSGEPRYGLTLGGLETGFGATHTAAWYHCTGFVRLVRISLTELIRGKVRVDDLSGPVGIVSIINETGRQSPGFGAAMINIANFGAFIAINLAVFNLLPIPALDGGRIFFLLLTRIIERISRRRLNPKYESYIHGAAYILLLGLMAFVMLNDVIRIIKG
jgi:regulator of sigma E protease